MEKDNEKGSSREINNEKLKTEESVDCIESISISHSDQIPNLANAEQEEPLDSASENNFVSESYKVDSSTEIDDYVYDSEDSTFFNDAVDESSADENFIEVKKKKKKEKESHTCSATCLIVREKLRVWAINFCIVQTIITALLMVLNGIFPCLPQHGKTLIRTKTEFTVTSFCPENSQDHSEFAYIGISTQLQRIINPANHPENKVLKLQFNVDGLPLFKSGGIEFWPILGKVHFMSDLYDPFIIAVYKGIGKPSLLNRYFKEFVKELNHLLQNGIVIDKEFFTIEIMCFVCDTPARVFVKNTCGHTGYFACGRCSQKGQNIENRTIFSSVSAPKRTDKTFRQQDQPEHHNGFSPLLNIKPTIDMIYHFSLDFMHMCCLGVMKKLLEYWLTSTQDIRLNRENIMRFTQRITNLSKQIPIEFQRQILQSLGLISA